MTIYPVMFKKPVTVNAFKIILQSINWDLLEDFWMKNNENSITFRGRNFLSISKKINFLIEFPDLGYVSDWYLIKNRNKNSKHQIKNLNHWQL